MTSVLACALLLALAGWPSASALRHVALLQVEAADRAPELLHHVAERDAEGELPKNIALSRRAYDFGAYFWRTGDFKRAREAFDASLRFDPSYAQAYAARASVRSQDGDQDGAIEDSTRAITLDPTLPTAFFNRGVAFGRKRNWERAAADDRQALTLAPTLGNGTAHNNLGSALMAQGKYDEAIEQFSRAIELNPRAAQVYFNRANDRAGHLDAAISDLNALLKISEHFIKAHYYRAVLLMKKGRDREALADLDTAIRLFPDDPAPLAQRGLLRERMGDLAAAQMDFKRFTELTGKNPRTFAGAEQFDPAQSD